MSALIFPVGHYLGPYHRAGDDRPAGHRVRLGASLRWLATESELLAWTLAHGLGELADPDQPWTRGALLAHGRQLSGTDLTGTVAGLVERRLLVEVDPAGDGWAGSGAAGDSAARFAKGHRLRALMLALGSDPDEPGTVLLGTAGQPMVALTELGHAVWRAGADTPTLWDACQAVAAADPAGPDPATRLPELLGELSVLLGTGAAYLDVTEGGSGDACVQIH